MLVYYYKFCCVACQRKYRTSLSPFELGSGLRRCPNCAAVYKDSSKEWPELSFVRKLEYVCPVMVLGYFGAVIVTLAVVVPQLSDSGEISLTLGVVALVMLVPWVPYFLRRNSEIGQSKERYNRRVALGEGIQIVVPE
jgi:hypothetical protein